MEIKEKNKYIIYNEDRKVFVFLSHSSRITKISLPVITTRFPEILENEKNYDEILNILIDKDKCVYLGTSEEEKMFYKSENNHLKKDYYKIIRNYYSIYRVFSKEDYEKILLLCNEFGLEPAFLSIEELKELSKLLIYKKPKKAGIDIDSNLSKPLDELDKRLSFIKY